MEKELYSFVDKSELSGDERDPNEFHLHKVIMNNSFLMGKILEE